MKVRFVQNVGKVLISKNENHPGPIWDHLAGKIQTVFNFPQVLLAGTIVAIFPVWGLCWCHEYAKQRRIRAVMLTAESV